MTYEPVGSVDTDVAYVPVVEALAKTGFEFPRLYVSKEMLYVAMEINRFSGHIFNIEIVKGATDMDEWWVEFKGKRVGSRGA